MSIMEKSKNTRVYRGKLIYNFTTQIIETTSHIFSPRIYIQTFFERKQLIIYYQLQKKINKIGFFS